MFKNRLFVFPAIFLLSAALFLTGCSSKEPDQQNEKVIKIGFIGPLTGDMKTFGESTRNAFDLAVEQSGGKIGDYKIETFIMDDRNDAAEAASSATKLIAEDKICLL